MQLSIGFRQIYTRPDLRLLTLSLSLQVNSEQTPRMELQTLPLTLHTVTEICLLQLGNVQELLKDNVLKITRKNFTRRTRLLYELRVTLCRIEEWSVTILLQP